DCGGELKTALVAQQARLSPEAARARLQSSGGQVRKALEHDRPAARPPASTPLVGELLLGIDGGGSRTVALLTSSGSSSTSPDWPKRGILGRGEAGPSNLQAVGAERALAALDKAVASAFAAAQLPRMPVSAACLGLAGAGRPEDQKVIQDWARRVSLANSVDVTTDAAVLLAGGTPEGWGLALVAGTGSIAYGQTPAGTTARAGGWGYLIGDEGSAYALVQAGLRAIARAADGRDAATDLTQRFLTQIGLERPEELVRVIYRGNPDRTVFASWAPLILDAAEAGDAVALGIMEAAGRQLAHTVAAVARALGLNRHAVPLALSGGVLLASSSYRCRVLTALESLGIQPNPVTVVHEPAEGALRLAWSKARS
ncbi:MAG TPA: BadF/BadG/BcrA/BcrD ATPase family protein, partial [Gemmataceae bacterium]|nr:BadF/BadG/BcrA/BcrD ATPase family protein [Gemmataceae bacterium]